MKSQPAAEHDDEGTARPGENLLTLVRQLVESIFDALNGRLDLESHCRRSTDGEGARVRATLAMAAAMWHNRTTGQPATRPSTANHCSSSDVLV